MENRQTSCGSVFRQDESTAERKVFATTKHRIELKSQTDINIFEISLFPQKQMEKSVNGFPLSSQPRHF
jgi:hypothetical protein